MNQTLSCRSTTTFETLPRTQLLGRFGNVVSTSKTGTFRPFVCPRMRGLKPTAINTAIHAKLASHFLCLIILRRSCAAISLPLGALYTRGGCEETKLFDIVDADRYKYAQFFPGRRVWFLEARNC